MTFDAKIISQFDERFLDEPSCRKHVAYLKWGVRFENFVCPKCHSNRPQQIPTKAGLFRCQECDFRVSVRRDTIFEDGKLPLRDWFKAIWVITNQERGINASDLKKILGLRNYPVVVGMLRKLRHAMGSNNLSRLESVNLEMGTVCLKTIRGDATILAIAERRVETRLIDPFHIRLEEITSKDKKEIASKMLKHIKEGATVWVDQPIKNRYLAKWYKIYKVSPEERGLSNLPLVEKVAKELKTWLSRNYRGHVQAKYIQEYLNEFEFWWNTRIEFTYDSSLSPTETSYQIFRKLLRLAIISEPMRIKTE